MRSFLWFLGLFVVGFAVMAVLAWPLYEALTPSFDLKFHRVANRLGMLVLLIGFILIAKRMGLADRQSLGYGLPRQRFLAQALWGFVAGVCSLLPVVALMGVLELRELRSDLSLNALLLLELALSGLLSGIAVALIEETFFRGAMHSAIARESSTIIAIFLTALLYSTVHFLGSYRIPIEELGPDSGVRHIRGTFANLLEPQRILDAFLALFAVGILLGVLRAHSGHIAACLGLHAGWVWIIAFLREGTTPNPTSPWGFLVSNFDGVVGWLVFGWTLCLTLALLLWIRRFGALTPPGHPRPGG
jgi:membrane protease YdiL (CAAX protease family)